MNKNYIIVGSGWAGKTIASTLLLSGYNKILGFVDDNLPEQEKIIVNNGNGGSLFPFLGSSKNLLEIVKNKSAERIILAVTNDRSDHLLSEIIKCHEHGIKVFEMPDMYAKLKKKIPVHHVNHHWIVPNLTAPKNDFYTFYHNAVNYIISLIGSAFFVLPLLPFIALAIKLDSKGPVFFQQKRVGYRGKIFTLLKLRTMVKDAHKNGAAWTSKEDHRITRVGKWLRKYRLDELPQFINILKGDMSLIGPRPEAIELVEQFKKEIPFYEYRYLVRPGISGWAQVNHENTCSIEGAFEKLQYDLYWIKNRSFWLDFLIMFRSIKVILTGFGSA